MNKKRALVALLLAGAMTVGVSAFAGCNKVDDDSKVNQEQNKDSVSLDKKDVTLTVGGNTVTLTPILSGDVSLSDLEWKSSNEEIVTVEGGVLSPVGEGKANVTVTFGDLKATCKVTVNAGEQVNPNPPAQTEEKHVTGVTLEQREANMTVGGATLSLVHSVLPADADDKTVTWSTDAPSVATVEGGVVTAVGEGEAAITVTTKDGNYKAVCVVTVKAAQSGQPVEIKNVTNVTLDKYSADMTVGGATLTLEHTVLPLDADDKTVTWSTDAPAVATVAGGVVTAVGEGEAKITVTTRDGSFKATCTIKVSAAQTQPDPVDPDNPDPVDPQPEKPPP